MFQPTFTATPEMLTSPETVTMDTAILDGAPLSWAVALAERLEPQLRRGAAVVEIPNIVERNLEWGAGYKEVQFRTLAEPIIDREGIATSRVPSPVDAGKFLWMAELPGKVGEPAPTSWGTSRQQAAMRAWVAGTLGLSVQIPTEVVRRWQAGMHKLSPSVVGAVEPDGHAARLSQLARAVARRLQESGPGTAPDVLEASIREALDAAWRESPLDAAQIRSLSAPDIQASAARKCPRPIVVSHVQVLTPAVQARILRRVAPYLSDAHVREHVERDTLAVALAIQLDFKIAHTFEVLPVLREGDRVMPCDESDGPDGLALYRRPLLDGPSEAVHVLDLPLSEAVGAEALCRAYISEWQHPGQLSALQAAVADLHEPLPQADAERPRAG